MPEFNMPERQQDSNKGTFGKVLNFAGSKNYIGAAYLSTLSILKTGAGYAALSSDKNIIKSVSALLPEAIFLTPKEGIKNINNFSVILIGCGLGNNKNLFKTVINKIRNTSLPIIIDADGLNILAKEKIKLSQNAILTPHPMEASRLLGTNVNDILNNPKQSAIELSRKYNAVIVLKLHRTIVCCKDKIYINQHGNSALAKAGTGDALAGIISGLVAQKLDLFEAAKLGVYLHSRAGEFASEELSEYAVLASDIPKYIHKAIKELL